MMTRASKRTADQTDPAEQEMRAAEVLRANRELAAYFRGRRTEREARSALKIIKAFIRDRERIESSNRRPLPGVTSAKVTAKALKTGTPTPVEAGAGADAWDGEISRRSAEVTPVSQRR